MSQTLSQDLRSRVIAAVDSGMSRNAAARRFGVGISTAIRWVREWRSAGVATAKPKGGDLRSHRIEAFREVLLSAVETQKDVTLVELAAMLERDHADDLDGDAGCGRDTLRGVGCVDVGELHLTMPTLQGEHFSSAATYAKSANPYYANSRRLRTQIPDGNECFAVHRCSTLSGRSRVERAQLSVDWPEPVQCALQP